MRLRILHVPDCPNVALLDERLSDLLGERPGIEVVREVVDTGDDAAAAGMAGSPTLLVDGVDPFAEPGQAPSLSCRLYPDETGRLDRAPSAARLRRALHLDPHPAASSAEEIDARPAPATAVARRRSKTAPSDPAERRLHQAILRAFAAGGRPPDPAELGRHAAMDSTTVDDLLLRLHRDDLIRLDSAGAIAVAYPFAGMPGRHRVRIRGGAEVYAMCAVDALGISAMLDADTTVTSTDPIGFEPITVRTTDGHTTWSPGTAVVVVATRADEGPSAEYCCSTINFFVSPRTAETWTAAHPELRAEILDAEDGERLGRRLFGSLLHDQGSASVAPVPASSSSPTTARTGQESVRQPGGDASEGGGLGEHASDDEPLAPDAV